MKNLILILLMLISGSSVYSQIEINPQFGLLVTKLSDTDNNSFEASGKAGWLVGVDLRFGSSFYVQPGIFFMSSRTYYEYNDNLAIDPQEVNRTSLRLKGLLGFKLLNTGLVKLRVAAGPTYEFQTSIDDVRNDVINEDDFNDGNFSIDAAVGVNILFLTLDLGYSWGLTNTFKDTNVTLKTKPTYRSIYLTAGIQF